MRALSRWTRWRVLSRSLFIQAGFNAEGLQSLGMLFALYPALAELYPEPGRQQEAVLNTPVNGDLRTGCPVFNQAQHRQRQYRKRDNGSYRYNIRFNRSAQEKIPLTSFSLTGPSRVKAKAFS